MTEEGTFCSNADVEKKAGPFVSSVSIAEEYTNQYIQEAEGWIMAMTKKGDLVSDYENYENDVKELLRMITSNLAAIDVIQYDMTGYILRVDAENQIRALWGKAVKGIETLKTVLITK